MSLKEHNMSIFQEAKDFLPCNDCQKKDTCLSVIFGCKKLEDFSLQWFENKKKEKQCR